MFQSLKGIIGDFNHLGRIADTAEAKFQSLKGIIGDFNDLKALLRSLLLSFNP